MDTPPPTAEQRLAPVTSLAQTLDHFQCLEELTGKFRDAEHTTTPPPMAPADTGAAPAPSAIDAPAPVAKRGRKRSGADCPHCGLRLPTAYDLAYLHFCPETGGTWAHDSRQRAAKRARRTDPPTLSGLPS